MKSNELKVALAHLELVKSHSYPDMNRPAREALDYAMSQLQRSIIAAEVDERKAELQGFKAYMAEQLEWGMANEENQEKFAALELTIKYGERSISLENCADAYNAIQDLLDDYISEL